MSVYKVYNNCTFYFTRFVRFLNEFLIFFYFLHFKRRTFFVFLSKQSGCVCVRARLLAGSLVRPPAGSLTTSAAAAFLPAGGRRG